MFKCFIMWPNQVPTYHVFFGKYLCCLLVTQNISFLLNIILTRFSGILLFAYNTPRKTFLSQSSGFTWYTAYREHSRLDTYAWATDFIHSYDPAPLSSDSLKAPANNHPLVLIDSYTYKWQLYNNQILAECWYLPPMQTNLYQSDYCRSMNQWVVEGKADRNYLQKFSLRFHTLVQ